MLNALPQLPFRKKKIEILSPAHKSLVQRRCCREKKSAVEFAKWQIV